MPLLPALLLACFAFWSGTFPGAAAFPAGPAGQALVLGAALLGAAGWRDPLGLGKAGRWLVGALLVAVALSLWSSPVARAGRVGICLLPAYLLLAPFVARCWSTDRRRAIGLAAWSAVVAATALWAIAEQARQSTSRAAMPLGHHNLLAAFLVITLPLVVPALRRRGLARGLAVLALVAGVVALIETRSFLGGAALALLALAGAARFERARHLVLGLALLGLALLVPRGEAIVRGEDSSAAARQVYLHAGWQGATERPIVGWGPGSTPWTLALHLRPRPGVNPPGEVVGEMHSLPLALAYELGFPGLALAAGVTGLFILRRWRARGAAVDRGLVEAGLAGVAGFLLTALGGAQLSVTALPLAAMLAAGAALAGARAADGGSPDVLHDERHWRFDLRVVPVWIYAAGALFALVPLARAQAFYERAAKLRVRAQAAPLVAQAMALDPDFPLYRARWAWSAEAPADLRAAAAITAARAAQGVAALWLRAGALALEGGRIDLAREALQRALALDPLSGFAPFHLATLAGDGGERVDCAARALLAEPRLAAASSWRGHDAARRSAIERLEHWPGIDTGWRVEMLKQAQPAALSGDSSPVEEVDLAAQIDTTPALAVSLHLFRRSAWPADVARIRVERAGVRKMKLPSAASMEESAPVAFPYDRCAPL
ncbi:MAG: O-antigen ligase family protein [Thermoanaerobaculia bacterium]